MSAPIKISAIICTYNREKYIRQALISLTQQTLPKEEFEIVVVNNNSTDRSEEEILQFHTDFPGFNFVYVTEPNQGLSFARNRGIKESKGKWVSFLDDDAIATPDFLKKSMEYTVKNPALIAFGGKIIPRFVDGKPNWYTRFYWGVTGQFDLGDEPFKILYRGKFPCGSNMTFDRTFFDRYGYFNTNLGRKGAILLAGEEKELFSRVKPDEKDNVMYYPDLQVEHCVDHTKLNAAYLKKFAYGFAKGEKLEVENAAIGKKLGRYLEFTIKGFGAMFLGKIYFLTFRFSKGWMLYRFGWWVLTGFWFKKV
jgi:glycosyltransferase involved in cell wall biosynthesis